MKNYVGGVLKIDSWMTHKNDGMFEGYYVLHYFLKILCYNEIYNVSLETEGILESEEHKRFDEEIEIGN